MIKEDTSEILKKSLEAFDKQIGHLIITSVMLKFLGESNMLQIEDSYRFKFSIEKNIKSLEEILKDMKEISVK